MGFAYSVALDPLGNLYLTGSRDGDILVSKYDGNLQPIWSRTHSEGLVEEIAVDRQGNAYITGENFAQDVFVTKYDTNGALLWSTQFGSPNVFPFDWTDHGSDIAVDDHGNVYVTGYTNGSFEGQSRRQYDVFIAKLSNPAPVPEPNTMILAAMGTATGILLIRRGRRCR
jgi:hypothetical protein